MRASLRRIDVGEATSLVDIVALLRETLDAERALAYRVNVVADVSSIADVCCDGFDRPDAFATTLAGVLESDGRGMFDLASPEGKQRNCVLALPPLRTQLQGLDADDLAALGIAPSAYLDIRRGIASAIRAFSPWKLDRDHTLRALVCDEAGLLAWIGVMTPKPPTSRQRAMFSAVLPAIRDRLAIERKLACAALAEATLGAVLGSLPSAAFLVSLQGNVLYANAAGKTLLSRDGRGLRSELVDAARSGGSGRFSSTTIAVHGADSHALVSEKSTTNVSSGLLSATAARCGLTPRQTEVLEQLIAGRSNRAIASLLGCAERTIEVHVRQIFEKTGATSRSALIASVWSSAS